MGDAGAPIRFVTASLQIDFRKPTPLGEELLVGHLPRAVPFLAAVAMGRYRVSRVSARAADGVPITGSLAPPLPALAVPVEGRGLPVPGLCGLLEPAADLGGAPRVLAVEGAPLEDALDGLGHVQPAAAERGVERHDAVPA